MLKVSEVGRGGSRSYLSKGMVVAQVAISLVLLIVAGLYVRTLRNLLEIDIGFNREDLLTFYVNPRKKSWSGRRDSNPRLRFYCHRSLIRRPSRMVRILEIV